MSFSSRRTCDESTGCASPSVAPGFDTSPSRAGEESARTSPVTTEKQSSDKTFSSSQAMEELGDNGGEEGRSTRRKVDCSVLPLLCLGFLVLHLDRMNLASALTVGYADDIGVDQDTINLGNQLMFLGTVLFEIPSNLLLQKFGPQRWISAQVFAFGLVATSQVLIREERGFLASRLILGVAESGYIPGALFTLSMWYRKQELAKRLAVFFFGLFGGSAVGPLVASGILKLHGKGGITGWQYLFLLEGLFTISVAVLFVTLLPASPLNPRPLGSAGIVRFSEADRQALQARLEPGQSAYGHTSIPWELVWDTIKQYRRWPHFIATFFVFSTWSPLTTYSPNIIVSLGFDHVEANALAAVGPFVALAVIFLFAFISDRTQKRGATVITAQFLYLIVLVVARSIHPYVGKWPRWVLWTVINSVAVGYHPVNNTWLQLNCRDPGERSISIAMWVMSSNSGLMVGTQYFRGDDAPFYENGLRTMIIMVSVGILFSLLQTTLYIVHNRSVVSDERAQQQEDVDEETWTYSP